MKKTISFCAVALAAVLVPLASAALINGTAGPDTLMGTSARDYIHGFAGDDELIGSAGLDYAWGGSGNDRIAGNGGRDRAWGGPGDDVVVGGNGADALHRTRRRRAPGNGCARGERSYPR